jgi:hypothetical protein
MKTKIEKVNIGLYEYDSIVVKIDNEKTEIVFRKEDNVSQYEGKEIDLVCEKGIYKIKPVSVGKKND